MIAIGKPGMAHADAIRVNQSFIHQSQLLFGNGKQRHQSPICQATPHDVRLRTIFWRQRILKACKSYPLFVIYVNIKLIGATAFDIENCCIAMMYSKRSK